MTAYKAVFTWRALEDFFFAFPEMLKETLAENNDDSLKYAILNHAPLSDLSEVEESVEALTELCKVAVDFMDNDFERVLNIVRRSTPVIRKTFSPNDAKELIKALEQKRVPQLTQNELIIGIFLILEAGSLAIPNFDILNLLIELETP